ncbi:unnamed protein product [Prunus armeniaca]
MNASNGLDHLTREAHQGCNASVEQVRWDLELVEGFSKHHTDRAASVHQDTPHIKVRNVGADNDWVMWGRITPRSSFSQKFPLTNKSFNDVAQGNTRFGVVSTELMKATKDTRVGHGLAAWSPGGRLGYDRCLVHHDILVCSVQGGEHLEPRLG